MIKKFRVYDCIDCKWLDKGVYLSPYDTMIESNSWFGYVKLGLGADHRYIIHRNTEMTDCNNRHIFEGDICKAKDDDFYGIVTYVSEECSYLLLDMANQKWYPLGSMYSDKVEVIGNIVDNPHLFKEMVEKI